MPPLPFIVSEADARKNILLKLKIAFPEPKKEQNNKPLSQGPPEVSGSVRTSCQFQVRQLLTWNFFKRKDAAPVSNAAPVSDAAPASRSAPASRPTSVSRPAPVSRLASVGSEALALDNDDDLFLKKTRRTLIMSNLPVPRR